MSRTVSYSWGPREGSLPRASEEAAERLLAAAKAAGTIRDWDADTGWRSLWIVGRPGKALRELRRKLLGLWEGS